LKAANHREQLQTSMNNTSDKRHISRVVPIVLTAVLGLVCVVLDIYNLSPSGQAEMPVSISYHSADNIEELYDLDSQMNSIDHFRQIRREGEYIRIRFTIPPSASDRQLYIDTFFGQLSLHLNDDQVVNHIDKVGIMDHRSRWFIPLSSSDQEMIADLLIKSPLMPKYTAYLLPPQSGILAVLKDTAVFLIWPAFVIGYILMSIAGHKKNKVTVERKDICVWLLLLSSGLHMYLPYLPAQSYIQVTLFKLGFVFINIAGMLMANGILSRMQLPVRTRHAWMGIGIVLNAVILPIRSSLFMLTGIRLLFWYQVLLLLVIAGYGIIRRRHSFPMGYTETLYSLFFLSFLPHWLVVLVGWPLETLYLQIPFPLAAGICMLTGVASESRARTKQSQADVDYMMRFKPAHIGKYQDLLELFLQQSEHLSHARNVSLYTYEICLKSDIAPEQAETIAQAAFLHDIGKMMVPKALLFKENKLTNEEYEQIKTHTKYGYQLFLDSSNELLRLAATIALHHHERYDGNGYIGLAGEDINQYAQIVSIADVFDAVSSERTYKQSWTFEDCFDYIKNGSGILFNPQYIKSFINAKDEIYHVFQRCNAIGGGAI
jgi:hypothetical protein